MRDIVRRDLRTESESQTAPPDGPPRNAPHMNSRTRTDCNRAQKSQYIRPGVVANKAGRLGLPRRIGPDCLRPGYGPAPADAAQRGRSAKPRNDPKSQRVRLWPFRLAGIQEPFRAPDPTGQRPLCQCVAVQTDFQVARNRFPCNLRTSRALQMSETP